MSEFATTDRAARDDHGAELGRLNSVSEKLQLGLCGCSLIVWVSLWWLTELPVLLLIFGSSGLAALAYVLLLKMPIFRTSLRVFENGIEFISPRQQVKGAYVDVSSMKCKEVHHHQNGVYVASKFEIELEMQNPYRLIKYQCDFRMRGAKEKVINALVFNCSEGIQGWLCEKLEQEGELHWNENTYLTLDGLKLDDPLFDNSRTVRFDEIGNCTFNDNELKFFRNGEGLPFLMIENNVANFTPKFGLFLKMWDRLQQGSLVTGKVGAANQNS